MDDILSETPPEQPQETPPETPPAEAAPPETSPEEKTDKQEAPLTEREKAYLKKAEEERHKRQELERKFQTQQQPQTPPGQPPKAPTFWEDPEGNLSAFEKRLQEELIRGRIQTSEIVARQRHQDFDEAVEEFSKLVEDTPGLFQQWVSAPDPAEFAYKAGRNHKLYGGGVDDLRKRIETEIRAKIETELKEKAEQLAKEKGSIPPSLSEARGTSGGRMVYTGPTPLDAILAEK